MRIAGVIWIGLALGVTALAASSGEVPYYSQSPAGRNSAKGRLGRSRRSRPIGRPGIHRIAA